jgi:hypothetical protein
MPIPPLTDQEALAFSVEHLGYEIERLLSTASELAEGGLSPPQKNGLVESWAIHLRVLIELLYRKVPRQDDVTAGDFFTNPAEWEGHRTPLSHTLDAARIRAHKEISHLTTERITGTPTNKAWDTAGLTADHRRAETLPAGGFSRPTQSLDRTGSSVGNPPTDGKES